MTLSLDFSQYVDAIVVPQCSAHFVVVHAEVILLNSPQMSETSWIVNFEYSSLAILPRNEGSVFLVLVIQQLLEEIP